MGTQDDGPLTAERLAELRESTEGLGARNRIHRLTNDELAALLDCAEGRTGTSAGPPTLAEREEAIEALEDARRVVSYLTRLAPTVVEPYFARTIARARRRVERFESRLAELGVAVLREGSPGSGRFA